MAGLARDSETRRSARVAPLASSVFLVCAGYFVGGIIGIAFRFPPSGIATIWPPSAILIAALLLTPPRTWWLYLLAAVPTHILLVIYFQPEVPPLVMVAQVASNDLHAVLAALTVFWVAFRQRVLANVFAVMTIPPLIVVTAAGGLVPEQDRRWARYAELGLLTMGLFVVGLLVFGRGAPASGNIPALLLAPLPFLLWAAVRLGPGGLCFCLLVVAGVSLSNAFAGRGPFVTASPAENTLSLQIFLLAISAPLMILAAIVQERQRVEDEARREREELAHVLRIATLGELTASLAHEINQPLTAIITNTESAGRLLRNAPAQTASVQEALDDIAKAATRASEVIRRLRVLFRKEHEKRVAVDANALIDDIVGLLRADMERRHIAVRFARGDALPRVLGDPVQLQQVVLNLVVNAGEAIDATKAGPRAILIETAGADGHLAIAVRDTEIGVKETDLERIFEHFVSSKPHGLGMGLAISRSIVQAHGGRIWATANGDVGLTVHVDLPVRGDREIA